MRRGEETCVDSGQILETVLDHAGRVRAGRLLCSACKCSDFLQQSEPHSPAVSQLPNYVAYERLAVCQHPVRGVSDD